jgi:putative ribosome biogenesis GTPase RsgA
MLLTCLRFPTVQTQSHFASLQPEPMFVNKVKQFLEILQVRHSAVIIGPAGVGKSSVWRTLLTLLNHGSLKPSVLHEVVNPKAITSDELYGRLTMTRVRVTRFGSLYCWQCGMFRRNGKTASFQSS